MSGEWEALARTLIGEPVYTPPEVAAAAGVSLAQARRLWRALGFPPVADDVRAFTSTDAETLRAAWQLIERGIAPPEVLLQMTRVTGQSLARIADAHVAVGADVATDLDQAVALAAGLAPTVESFLSYVWRRHFLAALLRAGASRAAPGGAAVVIGFADLVGFTAFSQRHETGELATVVARFEALAYEHIPERGGRVIKMIGDEVMFAVDEPVAAAVIGLELIEAFAREPTLPAVRVGLALGPVLAWGGDLYGPTVNLASRLVNIARPGTVLASEALGGQLQEHPAFTLRHLRPEALKGIGRVRPWVVRRVADRAATTKNPP